MNSISNLNGDLENADLFLRSLNNNNNKSRSSSSIGWRYVNLAYYLKRPKRLALIFMVFVSISIFVWDRQTLVHEHEVLYIRFTLKSTINLETHIQSSIPSTMEVHAVAGVPAAVAIVACIYMTVFYVAIIYSPTLIFRLPPPSSFKTFMIQRFICAGIFTVGSLIVSAFILPIKRWNMSHLFIAYGIRLHHTVCILFVSMGGIQLIVFINLCNFHNLHSIKG